MNAETYIKARLADHAIKEGSRHGGVNNMVAIAFLMKNRVDAGWYGGDWLAVLDQAPLRAGTIYPPFHQVNLRDPNVRALLHRIDDIYDGSEIDEMTSEALYYCELRRVGEGWFKDNILSDREAHPQVAQVGPVSFLR